MRLRYQIYLVIILYVLLGCYFLNLWKPKVEPVIINHKPYNSCKKVNTGLSITNATLSEEQLQEVLKIFYPKDCIKNFNLGNSIINDIKVNDSGYIISVNENNYGELFGLNYKMENIKIIDNELIETK